MSKKCTCDGCEYEGDRIENNKVTFCKLQKIWKQDSNDVCQELLDEMTKDFRERLM